MDVQFHRLATEAQLKAITIGSATNGLNFVVRFELPFTMASPVAQLFSDKQPLSLEWEPGEGEGVGQRFPLGSVTALKPSSMSIDPDGEVRFKASFLLPPSSIPQCVGVLAAGLYGNQTQGPFGRLTILQEQGSAGL
jgi:hypothetical protein